MPKIKGTQGTGVTERAILEFDWNNAADLDAAVSAAATTLESSSFQHGSKRIEALAKKILTDAGLPNEVRVPYRLGSDGKWQAVGRIPRRKTDQEKLRLHSDMVAALGYGIDSPQGYASEILLLIEKARILQRKGRVDEAMAAAFDAGALVSEAAFKDVWEVDALRGLKVHEGARAGHEQVHGTKEDKVRRNVERVEAFNAARKEGLSKMAAYEAAAEQLGEDPRTIQRAVARTR